MGKNGQKKILRFFLRNPFLRRVLDQKLIFLRLLFFCVLGFILLLLQETMRTLDSGIAIHSYTGIQMSISWTLGLQSIAQLSTNKHGLGLPVFQETSSKLVHNSAHLLPPHRQAEVQARLHFLGTLQTNLDPQPELWHVLLPETQAARQWGKLSRDSGILAKRGAGAKFFFSLRLTSSS